MSDTTLPELPTPLPWDRRAKSVHTMPGGFDNFLNTLEKICRYVDEHRPKHEALIDWMSSHFGITPTSASLKTAFLRKLELLEMSDDVVSVTKAARTWLDTGETAFAIAQIHSRVRFVGEMLHEVRVAEDTGGKLHTSDLHRIANDRYGFGWERASQVSYRRGWLQSAGLLAMTPDHRHEITQAGRDLLQRLVLHEPPVKETSPTTDPGQDKSPPETRGDVMPETAQPDLPTPLPWEQRVKGVYSMPGGYDGYLTSLAELCRFADDHRPTQDSLNQWVQTHFSVTPTTAHGRTSFLRNVELLKVSGDHWSVAAAARRWLETDDSTFVIAQLHSRARFIGEMLQVIRAAADSGEGLEIADVLAAANHRYGCGWDTRTQVSLRRGWLQSAGLIIMSSDNRLEITPAGRALLQRLELHKPAPRVVAAPQQPTPPEAADFSVEALPAEPTRLSRTAEDESQEQPSLVPRLADTPRAEALALELQESSVDSSNHIRFEAAVRDAFEFLGFRAEQLGGPGKTDVLLDARRGKGNSYTVTVDAKSVGASGSAKGQLRDHQVDWVTLREHRADHDADYSLLVGPDPTGDRLSKRGRESDVAIMSAEELAQLCRQHAMLPLGLGTYEDLFRTGGRVDFVPIEETFEADIRSRDLAEAVCRTLIAQCDAFGPMSPGQLFVALNYQDAEQSWAEDEIAEVLGTLSSNLMSIIEVAPRGDGTVGYTPATSLASAQLRLRALADAVAPGAR